MSFDAYEKIPLYQGAEDYQSSFIFTINFLLVNRQLAPLHFHTEPCLCLFPLPILLRTFNHPSLFYTYCTFSKIPCSIFDSCHFLWTIPQVIPRIEA